MRVSGDFLLPAILIQIPPRGFFLLYGSSIAPSDFSKYDAVGNEKVFERELNVVVIFVL